MFSILSCLGANHDPWFVLASVSLCIIGAFCTIIMLARAQECVRKRRGLWTALAGLVAGTSVWATHFMAMLAYDGGFSIAYDVPLTAMSIVVSVFGAWLSFSAALRARKLLAVATGGCAFGLGVALMHFIGMSALHTPGRLEYSEGAIVLAGSFCMVFGALSLVAVRRLGGSTRIVAGTILVSLTVCTLHFTAMVGLTVVPDPAIFPHSLFLIDRAALAAVVAAVSCAIVLSGCAAAVVDRVLTDVQGLANASLEGLLIVHEDRIVEVNESALALTKLVRRDLVGRKIDEIFSLASGGLQPLRSALGGSIGVLTTFAGEQTEVELFAKDIEYRGRHCAVLVARDMTERRKSERLIERMARHDPLTDLLNRREFDTHLGELITRYGSQLALLCLDLDNFKSVNDAGGHAAGDALLRDVSKLFLLVTGDQGLVFRLGGDEFAVVQFGKPQPQTAQQLAERILAGIESVNRSLDLSDFGVSIGIAVASGKATADALHSQADAALYAAKNAGKCTVRLYGDTHKPYSAPTQEQRVVHYRPLNRLKVEQGAVSHKA
jgi:diguanylate cyclase (GGDEF)-like protein